jgi:phage/plasmid-associated DNA primase
MKQHTALSANGLPRTDDNSWAFWRRVLVLDFRNRFTPNPVLRNELQNELVDGELDDGRRLVRQAPG